MTWKCWFCDCLEAAGSGTCHRVYRQRQTSIIWILNIIDGKNLVNLNCQLSLHCWYVARLHALILLWGSLSVLFVFAIYLFVESASSWAPPNSSYIHQDHSLSKYQHSSMIYSHLRTTFELRSLSDIGPGIITALWLTVPAAIRVQTCVHSSLGFSLPCRLSPAALSSFEPFQSSSLLSVLLNRCVLIPSHRFCLWFPWSVCPIVLGSFVFCHYFCFSLVFMSVVIGDVFEAQISFLWNLSSSRINTLENHCAWLVKQHLESLLMHLLIFEI